MACNSLSHSTVASWNERKRLLRLATVHLDKLRIIFLSFSGVVVVIGRLNGHYLEYRPGNSHDPQKPLSNLMNVQQSQIIFSSIVKVTEPFQIQRYLAQ